MPAEYTAPSELVKAQAICLGETLTSIAPSSRPNIHVGLIITVDSFCGSETQREKVLTHFPEALCVEMEGCAIVQVCYLLKKQCLIVRSISDSGNKGEYDNFSVCAAASLAVTS